MKKLSVVVLSLFLFHFGLFAQNYSTLVYPDANGLLVYAGYANECQQIKQ